MTWLLDWFLAFCEHLCDPRFSVYEKFRNRRVHRWADKQVKKQKRKG